MDSKHRESAEMPDGLPIRQRRAAGFQSRRHTCAVFWIACNRLADAPRTVEPAFNEREIDFLDLSPGELLRQIAMRLIRFRHQQHAAGVPVEAMHNTGPKIAA